MDNKKIETFDISIVITEFNKNRAMTALEQAIKSIKEGDTDCSSHPTTCEPYIPYIYFSCRPRSQEIYYNKEEWIDQFNDEEKKSMRFTDE